MTNAERLAKATALLASVHSEMKDCGGSLTRQMWSRLEAYVEGLSRAPVQPAAPEPSADPDNYYHGLWQVECDRTHDASLRAETAESRLAVLQERLEAAELQAMTQCFNVQRYMPEKYKPRDVPSKLGYLVEECGEVLAAAGKCQRWGLESYNPEVPEDERETNREWLLRELRDLKRALYFIEVDARFLSPGGGIGGKT